MLAEFPTSQGDRYEQKDYLLIKNPKVIEFKRQMDITLWQLRSRLYEIQATVLASTSLTHLMELAKIARSLKQEVDAV
jgi:hypothetical protein